MKKTTAGETAQQTVGLKMVFALRHGEYDDRTRELSDYGKKQSRFIAEKLRGIIPARFAVKVLSSPAVRAKQGADIIAEVMGSQAVICEVLGTDEYSEGELVRKTVLPLVDGADVLIVITHHDAPSGVANAFAKASFKKGVGRSVSMKGDGFLVDLVSGNIVPSVVSHRV